MKALHRLAAHKRYVYLFGATFIAYANYSVFFKFYEYLNTLPIDPEWYGPIIGLFSGVSLLVRPVISPFFHPGNARKYLYLGTVFVILTLAAYTWAGGLWSLVLIRILHGLAFVVLGAAMMTLTIELVPKDKSGQFFGLLSIVILIPNTIIPPVLPFLYGLTGGFTQTLLVFACLSVLVFPLVRGAAPESRAGQSPSMRRSLSWAEIKADLKTPTVLSLLTAMLLFYCGHALVFFFLDGLGKTIGIVSTGLFLTLSTIMEIGTRVVGGSLLDRYAKARLATYAILLLAVGYVLLALAASRSLFFGVGLIMGLGWGVAMPLFNAMMFEISEPRFRSFNINLGMQMYQAGFFVGPFVGGLIVTAGGYAWLYYFCGVLSLASAALVWFITSASSAPAPEGAPT